MAVPPLHNHGCSHGAMSSSVATHPLTFGGDITTSSLSSLSSLSSSTFLLPLLPALPWLPALPLLPDAALAVLAPCRRPLPVTLPVAADTARLPPPGAATRLAGGSWGWGVCVCV